MIDEKKTVRYSIEYLNTMAKWMGWNPIKDNDNFWEMITATEAYNRAIKYMPKDIELRIVETTRIIMDYSPNEDEE